MNPTSVIILAVCANLFWTSLFAFILKRSGFQIAENSVAYEMFTDWCWPICLIFIIITLIL
jgi:hypothetical protein